MNPARYAMGWAEVRITGAEPERVLQALAERGIAFWDAAPPEDYSLCLKTGAGAWERLGRIAAAEGCEAELVSLHGLPALRKTLGRRASLWILLGAVLVLLCASLSRVWDIRVEGADRIPERVLLDALEECGVYPGARWTEFSQDQIRNSMLLRLPALRWLTVTVRGCRARVIVRERTEKIEPVREREYARIVADRPGLVTAVRALRGTAETEPGRMLLPGDAVIGGYTTGRFGVQGPVRAVGWAELRSWYDISMAAPAAVSAKTATGSSRTLWSLVLGKKRVNFYKDSSICPGECDKIIEKYDLALPGVFRLPVALEKTVVTTYSLDPQRADTPPEEMELALTRELQRRLGDGGEILSSSFSRSETKGLVIGTLRAECRETTGVPVLLTEAELAEIQSKIP